MAVLEHERAPCYITYTNPPMTLLAYASIRGFSIRRNSNTSTCGVCPTELDLSSITVSANHRTGAVHLQWF